MTFAQAVNEVNVFIAKSTFGNHISKAQQKRTYQALGILQTAANYARFGHYDKLAEYVEDNSHE